MPKIQLRKNTKPEPVEIDASTGVTEEQFERLLDALLAAANAVIEADTDDEEADVTDDEEDADAEPEPEPAVPAAAKADAEPEPPQKPQAGPRIQPQQKAKYTNRNSDAAIIAAEYEDYGQPVPAGTI